MRDKRFECDQCGKKVGEYLYGSKDDPRVVENNAKINLTNAISLPDILCLECHGKIQLPVYATFGV